MRIAVVAGPGGAGSTTIAAALATGARRRGLQVRLLTADPDIADLVDGSPAPPITRIDAAATAASAWPALTDYLSSLGIAGDLDPAELAQLPGAAAIATLLDLHRSASAGDCELIVVDAGAALVDLLSVTGTIGSLLDRFLPLPLRVPRQIGGLPAPSRDDAAALADVPGALLDRLTAVDALLGTPGAVALYLVTDPRPRRLRAVARLVPAAALHGVGLARVVLNRTSPSADGGMWPAPLVRVPRHRREPRGTALSRIAAAVVGDGDPAGGPVGPAFDDGAVRSVPGGYGLTIPLPMADRSAVHLARSGDDLLVTVGDHCRRLDLPSVLQRCRVSDAAFTDDGSPDAALDVRFRPDPGRWPRSLAGAAAAAAAAGGRTAAR